MGIEDEMVKEPTPIREFLCPLCGQPNECVPANTGSFAHPCWCSDQKFSAELLAMVPEALRGKACVCIRCARGARGDVSDATGSLAAPWPRP